MNNFTDNYKLGEIVRHKVMKGKFVVVYLLPWNLKGDYTIKDEKGNEFEVIKQELIKIKDKLNE